MSDLSKIFLENIKNSKVLDTAKDLGINSYRMSLEWARIVPEPYSIDDKVLEKYNQHRIYKIQA